MGISRIFKRGKQKMPSGFPKNRRRLSKKLRAMRQQQKAQALADAVTRKEKVIEQAASTGITEEAKSGDVQKEDQSAGQERAKDVQEELGEGGSIISESAGQDRAKVAPAKEV
jgi:hypothetical protein